MSGCHTGFAHSLTSVLPVARMDTRRLFFGAGGAGGAEAASKAARGEIIVLDSDDEDGITPPQRPFASSPGLTAQNWGHLAQLPPPDASAAARPGMRGKALAGGERLREVEVEVFDLTGTKGFSPKNPSPAAATRARTDRQLTGIAAGRPGIADVPPNALVLILLSATQTNNLLRRVAVCACVCREWRDLVRDSPAYMCPRPHSRSQHDFQGETYARVSHE